VVDKIKIRSFDSVFQEISRFRFHEHSANGQFVYVFLSIPYHRNMDTGFTRPYVRKLLGLSPLCVPNPEQSRESTNAVRDPPVNVDVRAENVQDREKLVVVIRRLTTDVYGIHDGGRENLSLGSPGIPVILSHGSLQVHHGKDRACHDCHSLPGPGDQ
jgi:hypothetical protein